MKQKTYLETDVISDLSARPSRDLIVEEVREIRGAHAKKFKYDLRAIAADLKKQQKTTKHQVVVLPQKKPVVFLKTTVEKNS
jgi:hypothetical protein